MSKTPIIDNTILISLHATDLKVTDSQQQIPCILVNFSDRKNQHRIAVGKGVQLLTIQNSEIVRYRNEVYTKNRLKSSSPLSPIVSSGIRVVQQVHEVSPCRRGRAARSMKQESDHQYLRKKRRRETHIPTDHDLEYCHTHHIDHICSDGIQAAETESRKEGDDYGRYHALEVDYDCQEINVIVE
jgi:hypothetical protein